MVYRTINTASYNLKFDNHLHRSFTNHDATARRCKYVASVRRQPKQPFTAKLKEIVISGIVCLITCVHSVFKFLSQKARNATRMSSAATSDKTMDGMFAAGMICGMIMMTLFLMLYAAL